MELKAQNVTKVILALLFSLFTTGLLAQTNVTPKIIEEDNFIRTLERNVIASLFSINPNETTEVRYKGYFAILIIADGKVLEIIYPDNQEELISRNSTHAKRKINAKINSGEFAFLNIDQIIIPVIREWIGNEDYEQKISDVLESILPNTGYTSNSYVISPIIISTGPTKR